MSISPKAKLILISTASCLTCAISAYFYFNQAPEKYTEASQLNVMSGIGFVASILTAGTNAVIQRRALER